MSSRELIDSLRKSGDEKVSAIRHDAEQRMTTLSEEADRRLRDMRQAGVDKLSIIARDADRRASAAAGIASRRIRLAVEQDLAERLYVRVQCMLPGLRDEAYPAAFEKLAAELPPQAWASVRVNPADVALARQRFPAAEIVPDASISGGLDAASPDAAIRVVNTFEKRLERAWKDLLPDMLRDLEREAVHATPSHT